VALRQENTEDNLSILIDNSFCIDTIRNYKINPASENHYLHKDLLLQLTDQLLRTRDSKQLRKLIGKVKSRTDIEYNELADKAARAVVDGDVLSIITSTEADPPP